MGRVASKETRCLTVRLPAEAATPAVIAELRALLNRYPGGVPVLVRFMGSVGITPLSIGGYGVRLDDDLLRGLDELLGVGAAGIEPRA